MKSAPDSALTPTRGSPDQFAAPSSAGAVHSGGRARASPDLIEMCDLMVAVITSQHRSLRQAAEAIDIRQSTLSRRLRELCKLRTAKLSSRDSAHQTNPRRRAGSSNRSGDCARRRCSGFEQRFQENVGFLLTRTARHVGRLKAHKHFPFYARRSIGRALELPAHRLLLKSHTPHSS
jgi:hypothetical protein